MFGSNETWEDLSSFFWEKNFVEIHPQCDSSNMFFFFFHIPLSSATPPKAITNASIPVAVADMAIMVAAAADEMKSAYSIVHSLCSMKQIREQIYLGF